MKLIYTKLWLKKYIKYNHDKLDENKLNRAIINLSHRIYKKHGLHGHNSRQHIRELLVEYSKAELARYNVAFERPLQVRYKHRYIRPTYRPIRTIRYLSWSLVKILGLAVLLLIVLYLISHFI